MPWFYSKQCLILLLMFAYQQKSSHAIIHDAPNIYMWMERNSYICDHFDPQKPDNPIFIFEEEADIFKCSLLCGDPIETKKACGRMRSQPDSDPSCFTIPEICIREYIHEFTTTSHNGEKEKVKESFDVETAQEINQNNLEPIDLAVVNEPIVSNNNAETNSENVANEVPTTTESTTTSSTSTTTTTTTPSTTTTTSTQAPTTTESTTTTTTTEPTTTEPTTTTTTTTPSTTTTSATPSTTTTTTESITTTITTEPTTTTTQTTTTPTTTTSTTTLPLTTSTTTTPSTTTVPTTISTTTIPTTTTTSTSTSTTTPSTTTASSSTTTTTPSTTTATSTLSPTTSTTTTTPATTTTTSPITTTTTTSATTPTTTTSTTQKSTTSISTTTTPSTTTSTTTIPSTTTIQSTTTQAPITTTIPSTTTTTTTVSPTTPLPTTIRTTIFSNPTITLSPAQLAFLQRQDNAPQKEPLQEARKNVVFTLPSTTTLPPTTVVSNISANVPVFVTLKPITNNFVTSSSLPSTTIKVFTTTPTPASTTTRFIPTTTASPSTTFSSTLFATSRFNNDRTVQTSHLEQKPTALSTSTLSSTTQTPTRFSTTTTFVTTSTANKPQTSKQPLSLATARFIPLTTTTAPFTTTLPPVRSTASNLNFATSQFKNPQTTQLLQQQQPASSNFIQQQTFTQTSPPSSTPTTPTVFIRPIQKSTPTFGRFVLSTAQAVDLNAFRNRTDILRKIIKQQKIFPELVRDSTLTTRNIPFTTPEESKIIVDKRLQKLDETVKRFRTATPPFGFVLVSSLPTKRATRSTVDASGFASTRFFDGRTTAVSRHFVDKDFGEPATTVSLPSFATTEDKFKKFEKNLPKRITGNNNNDNFQQIVFPTTTSTRLTRATTTASRNSNLFVIDGEAFGNHFVFNEVPRPDLRDVVFGKVPSTSTSSSTLTASATVALASAKTTLSQRQRNQQLKRKIFFFRNRHSGEMVIAPQEDECVDGDTACDFWAKNGECKANPVYMLTVCRLSCHICTPFFA